MSTTRPPTEVVELYEHRNAIVHRFFLTGLRYTDLEPYLGRYELVYHRALRIVKELEDRQVREGKGMTTAGGEVDRGAVSAEVAAKLGFAADLT